MIENHCRDLSKIVTWASILGQNHWSAVGRTGYGGARGNTGKPVIRLLQQSGGGTDSQYYNLFTRYVLKACHSKVIKVSGHCAMEFGYYCFQLHEDDNITFIVH